MNEEAKGTENPRGEAVLTRSHKKRHRGRRLPIAEDREQFRLLGNGDILLPLERRCAAGTTHLRFSRVELGSNGWRG